MDLSHTPISDDAIIQLKGEWEFYWKQFIDPLNSKNTPTNYIKVPGSWVDLSEDQNKISPRSYATYRMVIKTSQAKQYWGIKAQDIFTACRIYVNGQLMAKAGEPGTDSTNNIPQLLPLSFSFYSESPTIEILIHVSNFDLDRGGLWKNLIFGKSKTINRYNSNQIGFDFLILGALLSMTIYHFVLYLLGKRDGETLFFSLFCLLMAIRTLITSERIFIVYFPQVSWMLYHKLELITIYLGLGIFFGFLKNLYPDDTNIFLNKIIVLFCIAYSLLTFLIPSNLFDLTFRIFIFLMATMCCYTININIKAVMNKRTGSLILLIGSVILTISIFNDILYSQFSIPSMFLTPTGFIIFVICSEFTFTIRFIHAEKNLIKSEEKNKALLDAYPDTILLIDKNLKIIEYKINFNLLPILKTMDLKNKTIDKTFPKEFSTPILDKISSGHVERETIEIQFKHNELNHFYETRFINNQEKILIIIRNISDKKNIQKKLEFQKEQLIQADKLASLGTLVAGVAHEINNPNTSILLSSEIHKEAWTWVFNLIEEEFAPNKTLSIGNMHYDDFKNEMEKSFDRIVRNSKRIKVIVEELKAFSRKQIDKPTNDVDINKTVKSAIAKIQQTIDEYTDHFSTLFETNLPLIKGDSNRLKQAFINIIKNACHALDNKLQKIEIKTYFNSDSHQVCIDVIDEGIGMDEDTKKRIMDPFFTTKRLAGGLGLGLSISNKIIKDHNGKLEFLSHPGEGTTARIVFSIKGENDD